MFRKFKTYWKLCHSATSAKLLKSTKALQNTILTFLSRSSHMLKNVSENAKITEFWITAEFVNQADLFCYTQFGSFLVGSSACTVNSLGRVKCLVTLHQFILFVIERWPGEEQWEIEEMQRICKVVERNQCNAEQAWQKIRKRRITKANTRGESSSHSKRNVKDRERGRTQRAKTMLQACNVPQGHRKACHVVLQDMKH